MSGPIGAWAAIWTNTVRGVSWLSFFFLFCDSNSLACNRSPIYSELYSIALWIDVWNIIPRYIKVSFQPPPQKSMFSRASKDWLSSWTPNRVRGSMAGLASGPHPLTLTFSWGRCEKNYLPKEEGREGGEKSARPAGPGARTRDLPRGRWGSPAARHGGCLDKQAFPCL